MIDPKTVVTYAQYNEDIILLALLDDVEKGFYVDVGANYAVIDSVTNLFYEKGWQGINIEPVKELHEKLLKARKRDLNLQCGVGEKTGELTFREYVDTPGHSTFAVKEKEGHDNSNHYTDYKVPIKTLAAIFNEHDPDHIHFLKIDVEGFEYEVIKGNDWKKYRPEVVCIEANHVDKDWRPMLTDNQYRFFVADGLNEYYIAEESWHRTEGFAEKAIKLHYYSLKKHQFDAWLDDSQHLEKVLDAHKTHLEIIKDLQQTNQGLGRLSLEGKSFAKRVVICVYGLTVDWVKYARRKQ